MQIVRLFCSMAWRAFTEFVHGEVWPDQNASQSEQLPPIRYEGDRSCPICETGAAWLWGMW